MRTLERLTVRNFKSIREQTLELRPLNVFIGGNGVGKSNLIGVFRFLREIVFQRLGEHVLEKGGANTFLHFGRKRSPRLSLKLEFGEGDTSNAYQIDLQATDDDSLFISKEQAFFHKRDEYEEPFDLEISWHSKESKLRKHPHICARQVTSALESYRVYHFHDTSETATVKAIGDVDDNRYLRPRAENLAAFLYWLQEKHPNRFDNVERTVRQVAPFFESFRLAPSRLNESKIRLEWKEQGSEDYFNAASLSDGTLRFICLVTLLLQPELPAIVLLDEPELGLHPAAIGVLADLLESASTRTQIIASTQSVTLVDQLTPGQVWAVEREDGQSVFRSLAKADMEAWLDDYSLGELWEKNLLGARP